MELDRTPRSLFFLRSGTLPFPRLHPIFHLTFILKSSFVEPPPPSRQYHWRLGRCGGSRRAHTAGSWQLRVVGLRPGGVFDHRGAGAHAHRASTRRRKDHLHLFQHGGCKSLTPFSHQDFRAMIQWRHSMEPRLTVRLLRLCKASRFGHPTPTKAQCLEGRVPTKVEVVTVCSLELAVSSRT